ncbi:MAG: glycosyltransferase [Desulfovibrio sp.]|nr:glycosyltransferase [Desulfovibrio sp.]MBI4957950.1 glycosyltransferase [Desulfovibrio sp.]
MDFPKVSIIVPTYNQVQYLGACLDSIWFQEYPRIEIIVMDDCSTDGTGEFLEEYARRVRSERTSYASRYDEATDTLLRTEHLRWPQEGRDLIVERNERNRGSTWTYNKGFAAATGEYTTYVASDDICHPRMVAELAAPLMEDKADFVYSDMFIIDDQGRILRRFSLPDYDFTTCFADWYLCGVSKLYRRSLLDRFGPMNVDYLANDHEQFLRFALGGVRFLHVPRVLYSVRSHEQRNVGVHSPSNWSKLLEESKSLVRVARKALAEGRVPG